MIATTPKEHPPYPPIAGLVCLTAIVTVIGAFFFAVNGEWFRSPTADGKATSDEYSAAGLTVMWGVLFPLLSLIAATGIRVLKGNDYKVRPAIGVATVVFVLGCCAYALWSLNSVYGTAPFIKIVTDADNATHEERPCDYKLGTRVDSVCTPIGFILSLVAWMELWAQNFKARAAPRRSAAAAPTPPKKSKKP